MNCNNCNTELTEDNACHFDSEVYCDDCHDMLTSECCNCGERFYNTELVITADDNEGYCQGCFDELFITCDDCGEIARREDSFEIPGGHLCYECYSNNYVVCCNCNDVVNVNDAEIVGGNPYCQSCFEDN